jgi:hypothetical protein
MLFSLCHTAATTACVNTIYTEYDTFFGVFVLILYYNIGGDIEVEIADLATATRSADLANFPILAQSR